MEFVRSVLKYYNNDINILYNNIKILKYSQYDEELIKFLVSKE